MLGPADWDELEMSDKMDQTSDGDTEKDEDEHVLDVDKSQKSTFH